MSERHNGILIVEARFYEDISDELARGAIAVLESGGRVYERVEVPGALEIPGTIALAGDRYEGYVALGCVIRGETSHYDIVAGESARGIMDLTVRRGLAIGNGIITVENIDQALARAGVAEKDKGGFAASACLAMISLRSRLQAGAAARKTQ